MKQNLFFLYACESNAGIFTCEIFKKMKDCDLADMKIDDLTQRIKENS
jgi:hypothetical protein